MQSTGVSIKGATAVVLGRSDIVGSPVAYMLRNRDATVTQCHSHTKNLQDVVRQSNHCNSVIFELLFSQVKTADILVAAIGKAELVKGSWIKPGAVVIDVGINYIPGWFIPPSLAIRLSTYVYDIRLDKKIWAPSRRRRGLYLRF